MWVGRHVIPNREVNAYLGYGNELFASWAYNKNIVYQALFIWSSLCRAGSLVISHGEVKAYLVYSLETSFLQVG